MTTVAWDGKMMAADTLSVDGWGLKETRSKIFKGECWIAGCAGDVGQIERWRRAASGLSFQAVINMGVPNWHKDDNDPSILITNGYESYRAVGGVFLINDRPQFAIGSGRDFALAAMHLGFNAQTAVEVAMQFDNNTGGEITVLSLP